jgi:hypothetical protein
MKKIKEIGLHRRWEIWNYMNKYNSPRGKRKPFL